DGVRHPVRPLVPRRAARSAARPSAVAAGALSRLPVRRVRPAAGDPARPRRGGPRSAAVDAADVRSLAPQSARVAARRSYRIARVITRLNIGGPSIQAIDLSRELSSGGFETCLIHGHLADGEGDMTTLLPLGGTRAIYVDDLVRPVSPLHDVRALWRIYRALRP